MGREGFGLLSAPAFTSYAKELEEGDWAGVKAARNDAPDAPVLGWIKRGLGAAIQEVAAEQGQGSDLDVLDQDWDDSERRFVFAVAERAVAREAATRAAALRVQTALCPGGTTGMTNLDFDGEVDFGRNQVRVAHEGSLAADVKKLGLTGHLDDIGKATEALAAAAGRSGSSGRQARSRRITQATRRCGATFNFAYEAVDRLLVQAADGKVRDQLQAIRDSFDRLLERNLPVAGAPAKPVPPAPPAGPAKPA